MPDLEERVEELEQKVSDLQDIVFMRSYREMKMQGKENLREKDKKHMETIEKKLKKRGVLED